MENHREQTSPERQLGLTVLHHRTARDWSQRELADRMTRSGMRMTQSQVAKTEGGDRPVRLDEAAAFAELFGLTIADLISPPGIRHELELAGEVVRLAYRELERANLDLVIAQREFLDMQMTLTRTGWSATDEERAYMARIESMTIEQLHEDVEKLLTERGRDGQHQTEA